jgi:ketosteroid isomerase-like protein
MTLLLATSTLAADAFGADALPASASAQPPASATVQLPEGVQLTDLVAGLDRMMFDAYNAHDLDKLMALFATDLEFFHDKGGLLGFEQVKAGFTNVFANNKDIRRDLVPGSLEVYPIAGYGAIEIGAHRFCHTENGAPDCGTFRFLHVWRREGGGWQVSRAVSYGH